VARIDTSISGTVEDEMERLGASLLSIALERAADQDVSAEMVIRRGSVAQVLEAYVRESGASTLVLGAPGRDSPPDTFTDKAMRQFAADVQMATQCEVIVV
jgi:nucleotide-binding universal stress UspA family protein